MIKIKSQQEIQHLRESGRINAMTHRIVADLIAPGVTTKELDHVAGEWIRQAGAKSSLPESAGFPASICVSINDEIGHGIPGNRVVESGDLVKVDISVQYFGLHTDCAITHIVGGTDLDTHQLVTYTQEALDRGISSALPGRRISDISHSISKTFADTSYRLIRKAFGHGIGQELHEAPSIANFGPPNLGPRLRPGMALAIEPVAAAGIGLAKTAEDGWTDLTLDGAMSAHFEHTILITESGFDCLTQLTKPHHKDEQLGISGFCFNSTQTHPYHPSDKPVLLSIAAQQMDSILMEAWGRRVDPDEFLGPPDAVTVVLKEKSDVIAGFFVYTVQPDCLFLHTLVISKAYQGTGLGTQVMKHLENLTRSLKLAKLELNVQTNNHRAMYFYQKLGFQSLGESFANSLLMRKVI